MAAAFCNFLTNVIGFNTDAEANRVRTTGLDGFQTLSKYKKEDVQSLCCTLRKSSNNPMVIGPIVEKRLLWAASLAKHYVWLTRPLSSTNLSRKKACQLWSVYGLVGGVKK